MWRINEVDLTCTTPNNVVYAFIIDCDLPRCITTNGNWKARDGEVSTCIMGNFNISPIKQS